MKRAFGVSDEELNAGIQTAKDYDEPVEEALGEISDLPDDDDDDEEVDEDDTEEDNLDDYPLELNHKTLGNMGHGVGQGSCPNCGPIAGVQTLEARIGMVSENYVQYSISAVMYCMKRVCVGAQPYSVNTNVRKLGYVAAETSFPYKPGTVRRCLIVEEDGTETVYGPGYCKQHCDRFPNVLDEQFVIITGTRSAHSEHSLIRALQSGPVTTCYHRKKADENCDGIKDEFCSNGCNHANSIVGYTEDKYIIQESRGKGFGAFGFSNGTWGTTRTSNCAQAITRKAYYPHIIYDYDRANAYFEKIDSACEDKWSFVDHNTFDITADDIRNIGRAKNKCAFIGSACKGVAALTTGGFELIADFGPCTSGSQSAFNKFQMVIYLENKQSGQFLGISADDQGVPKLIVVDDGEKAAPFFASYSRFISFDYPSYHIDGDGLNRVEMDIAKIDKKKSWGLKDCNLQNLKSGMSIDVKPVTKCKNKKCKEHIISHHTITGTGTDLTSSTQRFDIGLSGRWKLVSNHLGKTFGRTKKGDRQFLGEDDFQKKKTGPINFRWNARQIIREIGGKALTGNMEYSSTDFNIEDRDNIFNPLECGIFQTNQEGVKEFLSNEDGKVKMSAELEISSRWSYRYGEL